MTEPTLASSWETSTSARAPAPVPSRSAKGRPSDSPEVRFSKSLSYILRHGASKEFLTLRPDGFVRVDDLLKRPKLKGLDWDLLQKIVKDNEKQRFWLKLEESGEGGKEEWWIRANQGHSVVVEDLELTKIENEGDLKTIVHGTQWPLWKTISKEGLKVMTRNHVHCAVGLIGEDGVTSGMRAKSDLHIYLDVALLLADSVPLFRSVNNVILTPGVNGVVSPKYFLKVVRKIKGGELIDVPLSSVASASGPP